MGIASTRLIRFENGKVTSVKNGAMLSRTHFHATFTRATMMNGNEKDDESALSPLVTAQERKRRILERRRKEKEQKSDDASLAKMPQA